MKVVLFCGGLGMRIRADNQSAPKPMTPIGDRPILWHIMRWYAHHGHKEFILCLGHGASAVKDYFLNYRETASNDFVLTEGGDEIELLSTDISEWKITFVDTGLNTAIGERLRRVRPYLDGDEVFLANYGDGVSDAPMNELIASLPDDHVGSLLAVPPQDSFHVVGFDAAGGMTGVEAVADMDMWINGGFFVLRQSIFDYLEPGDDLVMDACIKAAADGRFTANKYRGFWACMDTLKERAYLEELHAKGSAPWEVWRNPAPKADG
ncbi:glucose-1-phosphate cytidylyltransferase [Microbacterium ulmi]|uniref:Glucose-1-phosphate cytidylyltransferase n=1 Tax=Microbacterium ulmi TaxID=179095 RepID=A0A7Y2Q0V6_9MICO|nr:glucose-1-phosphate cytidylyltransferase [Microbacterium ulmi]NII69746.1 glucose-1-phosphate cytidylyltransferase [Microbacterium ulmi]NNH03280.1 glucose-1-phosphate cytidylyltransferase [Microbacterium ulmi]